MTTLRNGFMVTGAVLVNAFGIGPVSGQSSELFCSEEVSEGTPVSGQLVWADDEVRGGRGVQIRRVEGGYSCSTSVDDSGRFDFGLIPPGRYSVTLGTLGLRAVAPIVIDVSELPVRLSIPVTREDRIGDCFSSPRCAPVLARVTTIETSDEPLESVLKVLGLRLAIVLAGGPWTDESPWAVCTDAGDRARLALQEVFQRVEPGDQCERAESTPEQRFGVGGWVRVKGSDMPAATIRMSVLEQLDADRYSLAVSYTRGGLWGEGHRCEVRRVNDHWIPVTCRMQWVS